VAACERRKEKTGYAQGCNHNPPDALPLVHRSSPFDRYISRLAPQSATRSGERRSPRRAGPSDCPAGSRKPDRAPPGGGSGNGNGSHPLESHPSPSAWTPILV
jgi:hypothetical protein